MKEEEELLNIICGFPGFADLNVGEEVLNIPEGIFLTEHGACCPKL